MKRRCYVVEWCGHAIKDGIYLTRKEAETRLKACEGAHKYGGYKYGGYSIRVITERSNKPTS